jgi:hypothetical protein
MVLQVKEFTCASANGGGDVIIAGNYNKFFVFVYNNKTSSWDESSCKSIQNFQSVTAIAWKPGKYLYIYMEIEPCTLKNSCILNILLTYSFSPLI